MKSELTHTQSYLLSHHGGDGSLAAERTQNMHTRNHDDEFWRFWYQWTNNVLTTDGHLIDLGAGIGLFAQTMAQRFPDLTVTGIECAPYMLEKLVELPSNARILIDDLNEPANLFPNGSIDTCIANMLIHELHQPILLFKRIKQWLKPGGRLILIDMIRQPLGDYLRHNTPSACTENRETLEDTFQHFLEHNRYTRDDLIYLLTHSGFSIESVEIFKNGRAVRIAATG